MAKKSKGKFPHNDDENNNEHNSTNNQNDLKNDRTDSDDRSENNSNDNDLGNDALEFLKALLMRQQVSPSELDDSLAEINRYRRKAKKYGDEHWTTMLIEVIMTRIQLLEKQQRYREICCWYNRCVELAMPFVEAGNPVMESNLGITYALLAQMFFRANVNKVKMVEYWKLAQKHMRNALNSPDLPFEERTNVQHSLFGSSVKLATMLYEKQKSTAAALAALENCDIQEFFHDPSPDFYIRTMVFEFCNIKQKCLLDVHDYEGIKTVIQQYLEYAKTLPTLSPHEIENILKISTVAIETAEKLKNWSDASSIGLNTVDLIMNTKDYKEDEDEKDNGSQKKKGNSKAVFNQEHPEESPVLCALKKTNNDKKINDLFLRIAKNMIKAGDYDAAMLLLHMIETMKGPIGANSLSDLFSAHDESSGPHDPQRGERTYLIALCYYKQKQFSKALKLALQAKEDEIAGGGDEWNSQVPLDTLGDIEKLIGDIHLKKKQYKESIRCYLSRVLQYRKSFGSTNQEDILQHAESLLDMGHVMLKIQLKGKSEENGEGIVWFQSAAELLRSYGDKNDPDVRFALAKACAWANQYWLLNKDKNRLLRMIYSARWLRRLSRLIHSLQNEDYNLCDWPEALWPIDDLNELNQTHEKQIRELGGRNSIVIPPPQKFDPDTAGHVLQEVKDDLHTYAKSMLSNAEYHSFLISQGEAVAGVGFPPELECYPVYSDEQIPEHLFDHVYRQSFVHFIHNVLVVQEGIDHVVDLKEIMDQYSSFETMEQRHAFHHYCTLKFLTPDHFGDKKKIMDAFEFIRKVAKDPQVADDFMKEFPET